MQYLIALMVLADSTYNQDGKILFVDPGRERGHQKLYEQLETE